ncbi:MAG: amidophosphoribosyltransferase [Oligoflexales bacterium]|jgi:amidophosphoribosyltransferase|nr:amidophosphoribosyltransferase [Oligoflexales bacterium]
MTSLREECGIAAVVGCPSAAHFLHLALFALQHRGQEGCGIVTGFFEEAAEKSAKLKFKLSEYRNFGLVNDNFTSEVVAELKGETGIGHVRYSTFGGKLLNNIQPFSFALPGIGPMALAHNGNITNAKPLRERLEAEGSLFRTTSDSEVFLHLMARSQERDIVNAIKHAMAQVSGAYSLVILSQDAIFAIRDPFGFRPLAIGERQNERGEKVYIAASETCAFDLLEAQYLRDVEPGEIVKLSSRKGGASEIESFSGLPPKARSYCAFEPIYFSRPDSYSYDQQIYSLRQNLGRILAEEQPADADVVIAIPDSGVPMAIGYAEQAKIPYQVGLVRNHYVGRTFIDPNQASRDFRVRLKLNPLPSVLAGKRVVVVDDSVVRGTTCVKILAMLRKAGAKEIHFRVAAPPITHSCFFGVDTPDRARLLAAQKTVQEMREYVGADSLGFISVEGLSRALEVSTKNQYCKACFTGKYPDKIHREIGTAPTDSGGPGLRAP